MPSAKSAERIKAEQMYRDNKGNMKLVEIAKALGIPPIKVRKWKSMDKWDDSAPKAPKTSKKKQVERSTCDKGNAPHKNAPPKLEPEIICDNEELTEKQRLFCEYYVRSFNATQSYYKAYGCEYETAKSGGYENLTKPHIRAEVARLKEIKRQSLFVDEQDIVELHMRIAFADVTDFVEFESKRIPEIQDGKPVYVKHPKTGEDVMVTYNRNEVKFKRSDEVDGVILTEVSQGKDGAKVKLADKQKSLDFLARYFLINPMDKHKQEYDNKRLIIEQEKAKGDKNDDLVDDWLDGMLEEVVDNE